MTAVVPSSRLTTVKWAVGPDVLGAGIAESDFGTSPAIRAALHDAVDAQFLTYQPAWVAKAAESACAEFFREQIGWHVPGERVHLVPDVVAGLRLAIELFTPPGSAVIVPTPAYAPFLTIPPMLGREVVQVPSHRSGDRWVLDLEAVDAAFSDGAGLFVLCNPHNPLGQVLADDEAEQLAAVVESHGARVFSDEIHLPIVHPGAAHHPYASHSPISASHTITATAASKGWNVPGLKCAQIILSSDSDQSLWLAADPVPSQSGSILGAVAAIAAYRDSRDWLAETLQKFTRNRDLLRDLLAHELPEVNWIPPQATYLAWLDLGAFHLPVPPADYLLSNARVAVVDGAQCGDGFGEWVRFNFAMRPELLIEAVTAMAAALRSRRNQTA